MAEKTDPIRSLTDSVKSSLSEIISLKKTCNEQEDTITELNSKNNQLTIDLETEKDNVTKLKEEAGVLNKGIASQKATVEKLESERDDQASTIEKLLTEVEGLKSQPEAATEDTGK